MKATSTSKPKHCTSTFHRVVHTPQEVRVLGEEKPPLGEVGQAVCKGFRPLSFSRDIKATKSPSNHILHVIGPRLDNKLGHYHFGTNE